LYKYLNEKDDWLSFAQISQNVKATNFKPKNTYGYVSFTNYNESLSPLKISPERNSFIVSLSEEKFITIMDFIVSIFTGIDINIKANNPTNSNFSLRFTKRNIYLGEKISIQDILKAPVSLNEIDIEYNEEDVTINDASEIIINSLGNHAVNFIYNGEILTFNIFVDDPTPYFEVKDKHAIDQNNNYDLYNLINKVFNLDKSEIVISSHKNVKISRRNIFLKSNPPGAYDISFRYEKDGNVCEEQSELTVQPMYVSIVPPLVKTA
jgi:molecular chaperone HtpG